MKGEEKGKMQNERVIQAKNKADYKELAGFWESNGMKIL